MTAWLCHSGHGLHPHPGKGCSDERCSPMIAKMTRKALDPQ